MLKKNRRDRREESFFFWEQTKKLEILETLLPGAELVEKALSIWTQQLYAVVQSPAMWERLVPGSFLVVSKAPNTADKMQSKQPLRWCPAMCPSLLQPKRRKCTEAIKIKTYCKHLKPAASGSVFHSIER